MKVTKIKQRPRVDNEFPDETKENLIFTLCIVFDDTKVMGEHFRREGLDESRLEILDMKWFRCHPNTQTVHSGSLFSNAQ